MFRLLIIVNLSQNKDPGENIEVSKYCPGLSK